MMFKFSNWFSKRRALVAGALACAVITAAVSPLASAGLDKVDAKGKTKPTKVESMARVPDDEAGSVLKCWQEGRLIYQRSGMNVSDDKLPGATRIQAAGTTIHLLDLKQGICILDYTAP